MKVPEVYFGTADRQMEGFLKPDSFQRHFLWAMFFHGNLVVPDIFFYISRNLEEAILGTGLPHVLLALDRGMLIPTFRSDVKGLFQRNLAEIQDQGIQGVLPQADTVAAALDRAASSSTRYSHRVWPAVLLSEGFAEVVDRSLCAEPSGTPIPGFEQTWTATANLRQTAIAEALERSGKAGLRRGEIFNAVARHQGLPVGKVDDIHLVIDMIQNPAQRQAVQRFLKWVNYCYHYNQGRMFGLNPSLVEMDAVDIAFSERLRPSASRHNDVDTLCTTVRIPSIDQLLTVEARHLLDIRESETATAYFAKQAVWQATPSEKTAEELLDALTTYADEITSAYLSRGRNVLRPRQLLHAALPTRSARADFLLGRLISLAETVLLPVGVLGFITDTVAGGYCLMPESMQSFLKWTLRIKEAVRFEIEPDRRLIHKQAREVASADGVFE